MKKHIISLIAIALALVFTLGSVGAYNNNTISFGQFIIQVGISLLVMWIAFNILTKKER